MNPQRTIIVGGTISGVLVSASAAFALWAGLFGAGQANQVGTFQAIEHRVVATSTSRPSGSTTSTGRGSTTTTDDASRPTAGSPETTSGVPELIDAPTSAGGSDSGGPGPTDSLVPTTVASTVPSSTGASAPTSPSPPTSAPASHDKGTDDGRGSDD